MIPVYFYTEAECLPDAVLSFFFFLHSLFPITPLGFRSAGSQVGRCWHLKLSVFASRAERTDTFQMLHARHLLSKAAPRSFHTAALMPLLARCNISPPLLLPFFFFSDASVSSRLRKWKRWFLMDRHRLVTGCFPV